MADLDAIVKGWAQAFQEEVKDYAAPEIVDDSQVVILICQSSIPDCRCSEKFTTPSSTLHSRSHFYNWRLLMLLLLRLYASKLNKPEVMV